MLDLKAALDKLDTGTWVSLAYVSADKKKGTAGQIIRIARCRKLTRKAATGKGKPRYTPSENSKDPNHDEHFTRNVVLPNGGIRKLHIRLLFALNREKLV